MLIKANKTYFSKKFLDSPEVSGRVHSVFDSAINLQFGKEIITLISGIERGAPDSVELSVRDFQSLKNTKVNELVLYKNKSFRIGLQYVNFGEAKNEDNFFTKCELAEANKIREKISSFGFHHTLPENAEVRLQRLVEAIEENDCDTCSEILQSTIGLGCGLTPSADDALLGITAVIEFMRLSNIQMMPDFPKIVYDISENRTTDISRKYLLCALQKRFSLPLIQVVCSLLSDAKTVDFSALAKLLNMGHSSGKDTLRGVFIAISRFLLK